MEEMCEFLLKMVKDKRTERQGCISNKNRERKKENVYLAEQKPRGGEKG